MSVYHSAHTKPEYLDSRPEQLVPAHRNPD